MRSKSQVNIPSLEDQVEEKQLESTNPLINKEHVVDEELKLRYDDVIQELNGVNVEVYASKLKEELAETVVKHIEWELKEQGIQMRLNITDIRLEANRSSNRAFSN